MTIEISADQVGALVTLRIGNTGPPIPNALRPMVFEKFRQAVAQQNKANFGLGRYFCRRCS